MFPHGYPADALMGSNLLIAVTVVKAEAKDALLLSGQVAGYEFIDVRQSIVFAISNSDMFRLQLFVYLKFHIFVT